MVSIIVGPPQSNRTATQKTTPEGVRRFPELSFPAGGCLIQDRAAVDSVDPVERVELLALREEMPGCWFHLFHPLPAGIGPSLKRNDYHY